ncbi:MAG: hypothetical protein ACOVOR_01310 [Rhabdochlamydiaceae bacterium]
MKMYILCLVAIMHLSGCYHTSHILCKEAFDKIEIGDPVRCLTKRSGMPYEVIKKPGGEADYHYIERIQGLTPGQMVEVHYYFTIKNNQIVNKIRQEKQITYAEPSLSNGGEISRQF